MRNRGNILGAAVLALLSVLSFAGPARAGIGPSTWCDDGAGTETPIISDPVTFNIETGTGPDVNICYSTTEAGDGSVAVTGGRLSVTLGTGGIVCEPDTSPALVTVDCAVDINTVRVTLTVQGDTIGIEFDIDDVVCLRDVVVTTPTGSTSPLDIGACV